jgi:hypothetical protein
VRRALLGLAGLVLLAVLTAAGLVGWIGLGIGGSLPGRGTVTQQPLPRQAVTARHQVRRNAARRLAGPDADATQILFGDLHVHTTFSSDAYLFSLPIVQGEGAHPPADACDFARFCAELDFWSINDHAELLSPRQWSETVQSIRECNQVAGDPANPDLVSFLGWEWTDMSPDPVNHYGHKNVVVRGIGPGEVPARPVAARSTILDQAIRRMGAIGGTLLALGDLGAPGAYLDFNRYRREASALPRCDEAGAPDAACSEVAETPAELFARLDSLAADTLVIPHGLSWGIHAPMLSRLDNQIGQHDPRRERLYEVYSGHGSSEVYRGWRPVESGPAGEAICPEPSPDYTPCCWRAGELIRERCGDAGEAVCEERVRSARQAFVEAGIDPRRFGMVPGAAAEDWLECEQLSDGFLPAHNFRPMMSAQYALAIGGFQGGGEPRRFRFGLIGSSDNHKARAGSGYKEFGRKAMGDAWGPRMSVVERFRPEPEPAAEAIALDQVPGGFLVLPERGASYYYTGGLVAAHARGRDRDAIFDALHRREVYGTSGDRILLWFDLLPPEGGRVPMGSEVEVDSVPSFRVRAVGAFEQKPGCPESTRKRLSSERLALLCLGECYHPGERRRPIDRIEVVRIRPQLRPDEPVGGLVEDPWRSFPCSGDEAGCAIEFEDPELPASGRSAVYYVRAIQRPSPAVGGDPLRCVRDGAGRCIESRPCYASGPAFDPSDDCLAPVGERAWSSPLFLSPRKHPVESGGARS